jgi:K+-sensing histidine kinase KdpD
MRSVPNAQKFKLLTGYIFALALVVVAVVIGLGLAPLLDGRVTALFLGAVTLSAWLWGRAPALLAAILSAFALNYYFVPPLYSLAFSSPEEVALLVLFFAVSLLVVAVIAWLEEARVAANNALQDERVKRFREDRLLGAAYRFAAAADPQELLLTLLDEARVLVWADGADVFRWDQRQSGLVLVHSTVDYSAQGGAVPRFITVEHGRMPAGAAIVEDGASANKKVPNGLRLITGTAVLVPLVWNEENLGMLRVVRYDPAMRFTAADAEIVERLRDLGAATLFRLEEFRRVLARPRMDQSKESG